MSPRLPAVAEMSPRQAIGFSIDSNKAVIPHIFQTVEFAPECLVKPSIHEISSGRLKTLTGGSNYATWNVEGFAEAKQLALQSIMTNRKI